MMRKLSFLVAVMALGFAGCAGPTTSTPPEAQRVHPDWLVGTWQGSATQLNASKDATQSIEVTVTFEPGGGWKAMTGASGTSWLAGNWIVLDGKSPNGGWIRYSLKDRDIAGGKELWGIAEAPFGAAAVALTRVR